MSQISRHDGGKREGRILADILLAGLDLRQIQYVVDQAEQAMPALVDVARIFDIAAHRDLPEGFVPQDFGKSDDRIQRRPELMRHAGEKARFFRIRRPGLIPCRDQLLGQPHRIEIGLPGPAILHLTEAHDRRSDADGGKQDRDAGHHPVLDPVEITQPDNDTDLADGDQEHDRRNGQGIGKAIEKLN